MHLVDFPLSHLCELSQYLTAAISLLVVTKRVKLESSEPPKTTPNTSWTIPHTQEHHDPYPEQSFIRPTPVDLPSTSQAATSNPLSKECLSVQPGETNEEKEARTLHNIATIMGRVLSVPLQSTFRGPSHTPGPAQVKSKSLLLRSTMERRVLQPNPLSKIATHTSSACCFLPF
ncbi:Retrotransposon-derived protein PEG10 [Rhizoctonia solani]|uniref:Retrotransposon-derived protein PEG10 n=1 Tax=Rhizoctonia solani TaxID=456999 RepID=A0A8H8NRA0_9AGAM|nr:Retrotransposon-derived protein PEG10 [Rhizoctonia solani]QRW16913.1 Retrotransposon-derived protein PEG10 [Rhizoctonia solani]